MPPLRTRAQLWARRAAIWGGGTVAFLLVALRPWEWTGIGPWRGAYYPAEDFRGEPEVRRDADVSFDWGLEPPTDSIPSDRFGARWDTCLVLEQAESASFQLVADDGARLYIDGEIVIDLWKTTPPGARGAKIDLEPGVHHLRVEYWEDDEEAQVHLLATFAADVPPGPIPARLLEHPGDDFDDEDPCGSVER